jgi:formate dehydrogenase iron-sulfur subunit
MAPLRVYVPRDAAARSVGADEVAAALVREAAARGLPVSVTRTGSRGALWLEPLVELETPAGRLGYGPVSPADVGALLDEIALHSGDTVDGGAGAVHGWRLGLVERLPWLARQQRLVFARMGVVDPLSLSDYRAQGGLAGLTRALTLTPDEILTEVTDSGLRGRGGAGFPTGVKWRTVARADAPLKFLCVNADEGDSGTFADRMVLEGDPFALLEGMLIAARAVGAREGYLYVRSEYPDAIEVLRAAIATAYANNLLGERVLGSDLDFDVHVRVGAGAYICGEETAMLESLEGRRGQVRAKPPLPAIAGLFGAPTAVNNVLTLASVPWILTHGAAAYAARGAGRSRGTQVFQLAGNVRHGGVVETAFGITVGELVEGFGGGTRSGRPVRAVQIGGPLGAYLPTELFDLPLEYEALAGAQAMLGHGGVVVFDDSVDMARQARFAMEFCALESCGKCTPCRVGAVRGVETIDRIIAGERREENLALLEDLCEVMTDGSLCAMGGLTPMPVRSALRHFGEDFETVRRTPAGQAAVGLATGDRR